MPIEELKQRADSLRFEALALIGGGFGDALREDLGEVAIAGSVALDLMVSRDIDLYVRLEAADAPRLLSAVPRLTDALSQEGQAVTRIMYRDEHLEPDPAFPNLPGLYLGLVTSGGWKIDLWGWDSVRHPAQQRRHHELAASLRSVNRDLVLRLKEDLWRRPDYRSVEVYDFVLTGAGDSLEDFERYRSSARGGG